MSVSEKTLYRLTKPRGPIAPDRGHLVADGGLQLSLKFPEQDFLQRPVTFAAWHVAAAAPTGSDGFLGNSEPSRQLAKGFGGPVAGDEFG
jgi:hypothetical protein